MPARAASTEAWISPHSRSGGRKVAVVYPNNYRVGMSNLGYQTILRAFLEDRRFDARRVFWDGTSLTFPDGGRSLQEFDAVALSVSYQPDMVHLPRLLETGRVLAASETDRPILIAGGVALTINPETCAPVFDAVFLGDAEPVLSGLMDNLASSADREGLLDGMGMIAGAYVPGRYQGEEAPGSSFLLPRPAAGSPFTVSPALLGDLNKNPARPAVISTGSEFGNLYPLEVSRGCGAGCLFCAAGAVCGPVRFLGMESFEKEAERGLHYRRTIGLVGTAVSYHPELERMAGHLLDRGGGFSPSSLRVERITPQLAELLVRSGHRTVSLAPEAGSEDLRSAIGKRITDVQFLQKTDILLKAGVPNLKLYFMVGLPGERESDVDGIVGLVRKLRERVIHWGRPRGKAGTITVSVNPFVPKPRTAFERVPIASETTLAQRLKKVRSGLGPLGGVKVQTGSVRGAYLDALLSLGDRSVADVLDKLPPGGVSMKRLAKVLPKAEQILYGRDTGELPWEFIK